MDGFKRQRLAHVPKFEKPKKSKDVQNPELSFLVLPDGVAASCVGESATSVTSFGVDHQEKFVPPANVVASGEVSNGLLLASLGLCISKTDRQDVKPSIGLEHFDNSSWKQLRHASKPNQLNENSLFGSIIRNALKPKKETGIRNGRRKPSKCGTNTSGTKALLEEVRMLEWTPDAPVPKFLEEMHARNFELDGNRRTKPHNPRPDIYVRPSGKIMDWDEFLSNYENMSLIPPVTYFKQAPFVDIWDQIAIPGLAIELRNVFVKTREAYWVGSVVHFAGYRALVKYEDFGTSPQSSFICWISFCSDVPKPLGWSVANDKILEAGTIVPKLTSDQLKTKLEEFNLRPTIRADHAEILEKKLQTASRHWNHTVPMEALDQSVLSQTRLARIAAVAGDRVNIFYNEQDSEDEDDYDDGYWFHYKSEHLQPLMWSYSVGAHLNAAHSGDLQSKLPPEIFPAWPSDKIKIKCGMKFEARHPYLVEKLVVAEVAEVLEYGYFIGVTLEKNSITRLRSLYHITSPYVLPLGFAKQYGVEVDSEDDFYDSVGKDVLELNWLPPRPGHNFVVGHKLEAFEAGNSSYLGPATIRKVGGHLLYIHFDGWRESIDANYQWVDAASWDICPVGYAEIMGFLLQGPVRQV